MKQMQYILCVSVCVVSSVGLWGMDAGLTGPVGAGAGVVGGDSGSGKSDAALQSYLERRRNPWMPLSEAFFKQVRSSWNDNTPRPTYPYWGGGPATQSQSRVEAAYRAFITAARERIVQLANKINSEYPYQSELGAILTELGIQYERAKKEFFCVHNNDEVENTRIWLKVAIPRTLYNAAELASRETYYNVSLQPDFISKFQPVFDVADSRLHVYANDLEDELNTRKFSEQQQRTEYNLLQPGLARNKLIADHNRTQQLADGAVTEELERARLQREAAHQIEVQTTVNASLQDANRERELAVQGARDTAQAARHAKIIAAGKWMLVAAALSAVGGMGAYFGLRHYFKERPKIIGPNDTSIGSGLKKAKYPAANLDRLILTPELEKMVLHKFKGIELAIQKMLPLSNMMFFGPAGTGKTMAAQEFVRHLSGKRLADHIIVRGPAFKQFNKTSEAISALKAVIRFAEASYKKRRKPVVIVFDEAETLFADRAQPEFATEITRDLVTVMTSEISAAVNKHIMFILSTNFPDRIDKALLNRIDESNRIRFLAPGQAERESLLRLYLDEALTQQGFTVSDEVMNAIPQFAKSIDGMVGRQISSMVTQSIYRLLNEGEIELTLPLFKETIAATMAQKDYAAY